MLVTKRFSFDSAHQLVGYQGKCRFLHGHTYFLEVTVKGKVDQKTGLALDFKSIKEVVEAEVISRLDHDYLNDLIKQPTAENTAIWIWKKLEKKLNLFKIAVWETPDSHVEYYG